MSRILVGVVAAMAVAIPVAAAAVPTNHLAARLIAGPHRGIGEMRARHMRLEHPYGNITVTWARSDSGSRVTDEPSRVRQAITVHKSSHHRHVEAIGLPPVK